MIVTAFNPSVDNLERTFLANSYNLGITSIEVKNNQEFANNDRILVGEMGLATTEIVTAGIPNANGTTMPIGATLFSHEADTPIYKLKFDQVKFYRSTNGINGTYTLLATVNLDVTNANLVTTYDDTTSATGYYYKISMYNSISAIESAQTDAVPAVTGWARNQAGYMIDQIYEELTDVTEDNMSRDELLGYFNEVNDDLQMQVIRPYNFLYTRTVLNRTAASNTLNWPVDSLGNVTMWKFDRMDYRFVDNTTTPTTDNTYTVEILPSAYFRNRNITNENDTTTQDDMIQFMSLNEATHAFNYCPFSATTSTYGCFYLYYWTTFNVINSEGDILQTPTPRIYKLYAFYKYYLKRAVTEPAYLQMSDRHLQQYNLEKARLKGQDRRDAGTPRRFSGEGWVSRSFRR